MKVEDDTYYRVKATVTTLDPEQDATASLYTERKHPLYTEKTITAGTTVETEFTVRVTPVYYQKSDPTGTIADEVLSVCVLGENTALLSLQIQQVETAPVLWVLGDSTVTDGGGDLPFFPLQNYTGVGTGLTKYLPSTIAMVNEGEGGLNASDSNHFSVVKSRLKEGDYLYVEYGHNHKSDGVAGYLSCLNKYYEACKSVGATLILVGPIDRVQTSQYDSSTNTWSQTLQGYATAAKAYVDLMLWSGEDAAAEYVSLYDNDDTSAADAYLAEELAKDKTSTITNVAFVDLNAPSLEWYAEQSASGVLNGTEVTNNYLLTHFYFCTSKGGGADTTHPNDAGAENLAYLFYENADTDSYPALKPLLANFENETYDSSLNFKYGDGKVVITSDGEASVSLVEALYDNDILTNVSVTPVTFDEAGTKEIDVDDDSVLMLWDSLENMKPLMKKTTNANFEKPTLISDDVTTGGLGGDAWPVYVVPTTEKYPVVINDIQFDEDGYAVYAKVTTQAAQIELSTYGIIVITVYDEDGEVKGYIYSVDQVDNSIDGYGTQEIENFTTDVQLGETDTYTAVVLEAEDTGSGITVAEDGAVYSAVYTPTDIETYLLAGEDNDIEDFTYYGATYDGATSSLTSYNDWAAAGSASITTYLNAADDYNYVEITSDGAKNGSANQGSFYLAKPLDSNIDGVSGKYLVSADVQIVSGGGMSFNLDTSWSSSNVNNIASTELFTIGDSGAVTVDGTNVGTVSATGFTTVKYILDTDLGTATITVGGGDSYTFDVDTYQTTDASVEFPVYTHFMFGGSKVAFDMKVANLTVAKLKDEKLPSYSVTVASADEEQGTVALSYPTDDGTETSETNTETFELNTVVTAIATPESGYVFMGWYDGTTLVSSDASYSFRVRGDTEIAASFAKEPGIEDITSFSLSKDISVIEAVADTTVTLNVENVQDASGTPISSATNADFTWSTDTTGITVVDGVLTVTDEYVPSSFRDTVTVTAAINGVTATASVKIYASAYYEDFSEITSVSEWITDSSSNSLGAILDTSSDTTSFAGMTAAGSGKVLVLGSSVNGDNGTFAYSKDMGVSDQTKLYFGFDIEPYQIRSDGKTAAVTLQFVDTDGTAVFAISVNTAGGNSSFNGTEVSGFAAGTVVTVDTVLDFESKTMTYTLTNSAGTVLTSGSADLTAANLDRMYYSGTWQYGKFAIDNVYIDYETE
ncbi:MAG: hypothetical protein LUF26_06755 [Firmicutes bacterium]|nr:hypothetical protein [Bacillota bacterium]